MEQSIDEKINVYCREMLDSLDKVTDSIYDGHFIEGPSLWHDHDVPSTIEELADVIYSSISQKYDLSQPAENAPKVNIYSDISDEPLGYIQYGCVWRQRMLERKEVDTLLLTLNKKFAPHYAEFGDRYF